MKLIIESGATKSDWRLVGANGSQQERVLTQGMNVSTMSMSIIADIIGLACKTLCGKGAMIDAVYMYTAGVVTEPIQNEIRSIFHNIITPTEVEIFDDLTAAARATCGHNAGIAAILGTGSNSCQYDGQKIVKRIYSGGYILGDEGSAATLGKLFIADLLKGLIPKHITPFIAGLGFSGLYALIIARAILVFEWLCITFNATWTNAYFTFRNTYCFGRVDVFVAMVFAIIGVFFWFYKEFKKQLNK